MIIICVFIYKIFDTVNRIIKIIISIVGGYLVLVIMCVLGRFLEFICCKNGIFKTGGCCSTTGIGYRKLRNLDVLCNFFRRS